MKGILRGLAEMGFDGIELSGPLGKYGDDPQGLKRYLASIGLVATGGHVSFERHGCSTD